MFPELAMVEPGMQGVAEAEAALRFWREDWPRQSSWQLEQSIFCYRCQLEDFVTRNLSKFGDD